MLSKQKKGKVNQEKDIFFFYSPPPAKYTLESQNFLKKEVLAEM